MMDAAETSKGLDQLKDVLSDGPQRGKSNRDVQRMEYFKDKSLRYAADR